MSNARPMTAPAAATCLAGAEHGSIRARIASSTVSGTSASRTAPAPPSPPSARTPSSSSTWSGIPSVRQWTASATSRATGRPVSMRSVAIIAVSSGVSRASRTSSAGAGRAGATATTASARGKSSSLRYVPTTKGPVRELPGQRLEDLERQVVRPVEVLERDDRGAVRAMPASSSAMSSTSSRRGDGRRRRRPPIVEALLEGPPSSSSPADGPSTGSGRSGSPPRPGDRSGTCRRAATRSRRPRPFARSRRGAGSCPRRPRRRAASWPRPAATSRSAGRRGPAGHPARRGSGRRGFWWPARGAV